MTRWVAVTACIGTLTTSVFAHHPGAGGNAGSGGPIITIPATTLEQGHFAAAIWYEYVRLGGLSDAALIDAASKHIHAHSIKTIESAVAAFAYGVTDDLMFGRRSIAAPTSARAIARTWAGSQSTPLTSAAIRQASVTCRCSASGVF